MLLQLWMEYGSHFIRPTAAIVGDPSNTTLKLLAFAVGLVKYQYTYLLHVHPLKVRANARLIERCPPRRLTIKGEYR